MMHEPFMFKRNEICKARIMVCLSCAFLSCSFCLGVSIDFYENFSYNYRLYDVVQ